MRIITSPATAQKFFLKLNRQGKSIGFVPTMGALHAGHISLIKKARLQNDIVAVSIFVNPRQFGKNEDLEKYPRPFTDDKKICKNCGVDVIFYPSCEVMYPDGYLTSVEVEKMSDILCGKFRPGHFRGVTTVVLKLFNIIQPTRAYFGEKDYQQLKIIEKMVKDLNLPVKIISCPTVREKTGLALSSRNSYLSEDDKKNAAMIYHSLVSARKKVLSGEISTAEQLENYIRFCLKRIPGVRVEYVEVVDSKNLEPLQKISKSLKNFRILTAVYVGQTRLIDNI